MKSIMKSIVLFAIAAASVSAMGELHMRPETQRRIPVSAEKYQEACFAITDTFSYYVERLEEIRLDGPSITLGFDNLKHDIVFNYQDAEPARLHFNMIRAQMNYCAVVKREPSKKTK